MNVLLPLIEDGRVLSRRLERWFRGGRELPFFPDVATDAFEALGRPGLVDALWHDPVLSSLAERAFLPIVDSDRWERSLGDASEHPPVEADEWVAFAQPHRGRFGVALPDDAAETPVVSVFTRVDGPARRLSFEAGRRAAPSVSVSMAGPCGFYVGGGCEPGACSGRCTPRLSERRPRGIVCVCEP